MKHFIEWDSIDVRVDGEKIAAMAREMVARDPMIERLDLRFSNGLLRVEGSVRKFISVPFTVEITQIRGEGDDGARSAGADLRRADSDPDAARRD